MNDSPLLPTATSAIVVIILSGLTAPRAWAQALDAGADGGAPASANAPLDQSPAPSPGPSVKISGYVEAFYSLNFNWPSNQITAYRGFDDRTSSITIDDAALDVTGTLGPALARLALQVGNAPASYYLAEPSYPAQAGAGVSDPALWRLIQQAILGYQVPVGRGALVEAGIFLSPIGIENLPINTQWNWSRSDLFFALPYYHAGARVTYPFTDKLAGVFYVTNGWNDIVNKNPYPCFAAIADYAAAENLALQFLYFGGVEEPTGSPEGQPWRNLFDVTATWNAAHRLSFAVQGDTGFEDNNFGTSSWIAGALYARLQLHPKLYLAGRIDHFHEHDAVNGAGAATRLFFPANDVGSETATLDFRPISDGFSVRLEFRADQASSPMYFKGTVEHVDGSDVATASTQQTLTLGAVAWF